MNRRAALASLAAIALVARAADARAKRIAVLQGYLEESDLGEKKIALAKALEAEGYREGANLEILWFVFPFKSNWNEVLPRLARQMVEARPDCIVGDGEIFVRAAADASRTIPIVAGVVDPVQLGVASSLQRPGGNVTGFYGAAEAVNAKRIQILKAFAPSSSCVAWVAFAPQLIWFPWFEKAATDANLRVRKIVMTASDAPRFDALKRELSGLRKEGCTIAHFHSGVPGVIDAVTQVSREQKLVVSYSGDPQRIDTEGLLFIYEESARFIGSSGFEQIALMVARVLRGEKPAEMAFQGPTGFYLNVNGRTARRLGIPIPAEVRILADKVLE